MWREWGMGEESEDYDLGEYVANVIMADPEFTKTEADLAFLTRHDGTLFENLDSYIILRLLCENPANLDQNVIWRFQDVLEAGWISEDLDDLYEGLGDARPGSKQPPVGLLLSRLRADQVAHYAFHLF